MTALPALLRLPRLAWLALTLPALASAGGGAEAPVPTFCADYEIRIHGFGVGRATFTLERMADGSYLYRQRSRPTGLASWFRRQRVHESSRWRLVGDTLQPLEYFYSRSGADERTVELLFDWPAGQVENRVQGKPWRMDIPPGTLDKLLVQIALLLDLRRGATRFDYAVADGGRLKHFAFEVVDEETIELPAGTWRALRVRRLDDGGQRTLVWVAPALGYLPVRFVKHRRNGLKYEMRLLSLDEHRPADAPRLETPAPAPH